MVYLTETGVVGGVRVVRALPGDEPLALLGELLYLSHYALCHPCLLESGTRDSIGKPADGTVIHGFALQSKVPPLEGEGC